MTVLFGHPSGNPNSHHAALAHLEAGRLEAFCVPWLPKTSTLAAMRAVGLGKAAQRLAPRAFAPLDNAPTVQGRIGEWRRLAIKAFGTPDQRLSYEANDWLMKTMRRECRRPAVDVVHAYEDCALGQFQEAKRLGKACVYDMPIGYHPAWLEIEKTLLARYADWVPDGGLPEDRFVRPDQKKAEMALADIVLAPSAFVADTIKTYHPNATIRIARYGVSAEMPNLSGVRRPGPLRFLFVGQCSLRKGVPLLIDAWRQAGLRDATLDLVGGWHLSQAKLSTLPETVRWRGHVPRAKLSEIYAEADVFVFPTFFEGRALVIGEALAAGLPIITTHASGWDDLDETQASMFSAGSCDELVGHLRAVSTPDESMRAPSTGRAISICWRDYRQAVRDAIEPA